MLNRIQIFILRHPYTFAYGSILVVGILVFFLILSAFRSCNSDTDVSEDVHDSIVEQIKDDMEQARERHERLEDQIRDLENRYNEIEQEMKADAEERDEKQIRLDGAMSIDDVDIVLSGGQCDGF